MLRKAVPEVADIALGLKADEVVSVEDVEQLAVARRRLPYLGRRPGNVQEEADAVAQAETAKLGAERKAMLSAFTHMPASLRFSRTVIAWLGPLSTTMMSTGSSGTRPPG